MRTSLNLRSFHGPLAQLVEQRTLNPKIGIKPFSHVCFNLAIKWEYADFNPVKEVRFLKEEMKERILTPEEIQRLLKAANDELKPIIITALNTGMRLGEILSLKWSQINFQAGFIQVEHSKNGKIRKVPINSLLSEALKNAKKGNAEYLFLKNGKPIKSIRRPWENALKRAGIKGCHFHDLRHNFASYSLLGGADLVSLRDILGHYDIKMTSRCAHSNEGLKRRAVESLAEMLNQNKKESQIFTNYSHLSKIKNEKSS